MPAPPTRPDPFLQPACIADLLLYRMSVVTRSSSLPLVRLFEGELGITRRHWHVLALTVENESMTPAQIAANSWLDRPQISRGLDGLVKKGLIERQKLDSRSRQFVATAQGKALYQRAFERVARFNAELAGLLTAEERAALDRALTRLQSHILAISREVAETVPPVPRNRPAPSRRGGNRSDAILRDSSRSKSTAKE